jgi:hypothetical protein
MSDSAERRARRNAALAIAVGAVAILAGCGAPQPPTGALGEAAHPPIRTLDRSSWISRDANPNHPWLYVASNANNQIDIYDVRKLKLREIGRITDAIDQPEGISVDGNGTLYVSDQVGRVEIYPAGSTSPALTLSQGLTYANDAVTDADGNVYVANSGGSVPGIVVYPAGQSTPSETITSDLFSRPYGEVFDPSGDLYVADWNTGVCLIAAGSQQVVSLGLKGGGKPAGIAFDARTGDLFVNYYYGPGRYKTLVYAAGSAGAIRALHGKEGANDMTVGAVGHSSYLFDPDYFTSKIYVYKPNARKPNAVMPTGAKGLNGIALKPARVL